MNNQSGSTLLWLKALFAKLLVCGLSVGPLLAQNNTTNIVDGVSTNVTAPFFVGQTGNSNSLQIINDGTVTVSGSGGVFIGGSGAQNHNSIIVQDPTSSLEMNSTFFYVGWGGSGNQLIVSNAGQVVNASSTLFNRIGSGSSGASNLAVVTGSGSIWTNSGGLAVGRVGSHNQLRIENGGQVFNTRGWIGGADDADNAGVGGTNNLAIVTGPGSRWQLGGSLTVGHDGYGSQLIVTNGGNVVSDSGVIGSAGHFNSVHVTGAGSTWSNTFVGVANIGLLVGFSGDSNRLVISEGGSVHVANDSFVGVNAGSGFNSVLITGSNSLMNIDGYFYLGWNGSANDLVISDGGRLNVNGTVEITSIGGNGATASNNTAIVTGPGSVLASRSSAFYVGDAGDGNRLTVSNGGLVTASAAITVGGTGGAGATDNSLFVTDQGVLETGVGLTAGIGAGNSISNVNGVYQFTTATPTITPNGAGRIMMTNGTISYRGVTGADINNAQVGNISKSGNNAFRLNNATNASVASYTFDSIANTGNPTNYQRLALINNARWTSANLTVGTNGAIKGGSEGDIVEITQTFTIQRPSNPLAEFDLASSTVLFSGGAGHTNYITGKDFGSSGTPDGFTAQNFSYGVLRLDSSTDEVCFLSGDSAASNALYVTWLDLTGSNLVSNLHSPTTINLYYRVDDPRNAYLGGMSYQLTDCGGGDGGFLLPAVPEPAALALLGIGALLLWRQRSH